MTATLVCRAEDGRSPDLRVIAPPNLPKPAGSVVSIEVALRLQLRGQSRNWGVTRTVCPFQPSDLSRTPSRIRSHSPPLLSIENRDQAAPTPCGRYAAPPLTHQGHIEGCCAWDKTVRRQHRHQESPSLGRYQCSVPGDLAANECAARLANVRPPWG